MLSRKKIISRSHTDLDFPSIDDMQDEVWFSTDKLYQDHISEILKKWDAIDDEIWSKVICMERNRRIAKAYSRVPVLTINGSKDGFDGYQIGLNGFQNPMRDLDTKSIKGHIGKGVRVRMDESGNIIVKRLSNCDVFIRGWHKNNNSLSDDITALNGELELDKSVNLFDMKKFQASVNRQLKSSYPDRRELENQCICAIVFVKDSNSLLDASSWILLINIVALDLLRSRLPAVSYARDYDIKSQLSPPRFTSSGYNSRSGSDEDPYSILLPSIHSTSTNSSEEKGKKGHISSSSSESVSDHKPPELPPRDFTKGKKFKSKHLVPFGLASLMKSNSSGKVNQLPLSTVPINNTWENPYYCGMQARVPNYNVREKVDTKKTASNLIARKNTPITSGSSIYYEEQKNCPPLSPSVEMKKCQSSGYLNTLFSQSSNLFGGKKSRERSKKIDQNVNSFFYPPTFESTGFFGSNDSDIYQYSGPSTHTLYNRRGDAFRKRHGNDTSPVYGYRYTSDWD